jgi:prophage antirepressor-like protein
MVHRHAFQDWEGRYYKYGGTHLRAYFNGDDAWFNAKDVLSVLDKTPGSWLDTRFTAEEYGMNPGRRDKGFSTAGVVKLTQISDHPEAPKFRLWFERTVVFNLNRKKEMRETHESLGP